MNTFTKQNKQMLDEFVDYVLSFYGPGGLYDGGATREMVTEALVIHLLNPEAPEFAADSVDREMIRDIMVELVGIKYQEAA